MKKLVLFLPFALAACSDVYKPAPLPANTVYFDEKTIPATGIYAVRNVTIKDNGDGSYRMVALSTQQYTGQQLMTVIWCRADALAKEKGAAGWEPVKLNEAIAGDVRASDAVIRMLNTDSSTQPKKDWCAEIPPQAAN